MLKLRKYSMPILILVILSTLTTVYATSYISEVNAKEDDMPKFTVKVEEQPFWFDYKGFDSYLYVTNPSKDMERIIISPGIVKPVHVVEVESLTIEVIDPDGLLIGDPLIFTPEDLEYKWDAVVYPQETSLVFYIGFSMTGEELELGKYIFTYTLDVTFEGDTFLLVQTFTINKK